ncbi:hypothetical protein OIV83_003392 [Microbotryomycetes sp. JL201]|nr:hypothetical protein OIV83_003392 [Microbotryomycetes sp. JL201]
MPIASTSKWTLDYSDLLPKNSSVKDPPGYAASPSKSTSAKAAANINSATPDEAKLDALRQTKAWEIALAPAKNVPMQGEFSPSTRSHHVALPFMMYMTGGGVQIFSLMSVWFLLKQAVGGAVNVNKAFAPFTSASTSSPSTASFTNQKLVFVACQIGLLLVGLWKCNSMGLLPTHESDWLAFEGPPVIDRSGPLVVL